MYTCVQIPPPYRGEKEKVVIFVSFKNIKDRNEKQREWGVRGEQKSKEIYCLNSSEFNKQYNKHVKTKTF